MFPKEFKYFLILCAQFLLSGFGIKNHLTEEFSFIRFGVDITEEKYRTPANNQLR